MKKYNWFTRFMLWIITLKWGSVSLALIRLGYVNILLYEEIMNNCRDRNIHPSRLYNHIGLIKSHNITRMIVTYSDVFLTYHKKTFELDETYMMDECTVIDMVLAKYLLKYHVSFVNHNFYCYSDDVYFGYFMFDLHDNMVAEYEMYIKSLEGENDGTV